MRRTEIISGTMAAETVAAETKAGKGRLSGAKKAVTLEEQPKTGATADGHNYTGLDQP